MKRTGEMILTFIGIVVHSFFLVFGGIMAWMYHNQDKVLENLEDMKEAGEDIVIQDFLQLVNENGTSGWYIAIGAAVALIAGSVAVYFLRGNRNAKVAGYILIISAVVTTIGSLGGTVFGGILYFIVGMMCFIRRPREIVT